MLARPRPRSASLAAARPGLRVAPGRLRPPQRPGAGSTGSRPPRSPPIVAAEDAARGYEYVGQTAGSKEVEVRARVTGILEKRLFQEGATVNAGQTLFVIDPEAVRRRRRPPPRPRSRARSRAEDAGRPRGRAPQAARRAARHRPEGGRRRGLQRRARGGGREGRRTRSSPKRGSTSATRRVVAPITGLSSRVDRSPKAASSTPTTRC